MDTSAIHQAIRLNKYPDEMKWLTQSDAEFPEGITDLLRLCASNKKITLFAKKYHIETELLRSILLNFIDKVILNESNTGKRLLGLDSWSDADTVKLHYQFLIKIYHPDLNTSIHANEQTTRITKAYSELKDSPYTNESEFKNITLSRVPPKSFYSATQSAEMQISGFKTAFFTLLGLTVISIALITSYLFAPSNGELISKTTASETLNPQDVSMPTVNVFNNTFSMAKLDEKENPLTKDISLQGMLRDLEAYYENGNVEQIKPILANSPEIENQTDEQIQAKLETLFKITQERKMLLYDFEWLNVSGNIQGSGKFLSRYQMVGEKNWETRKGIAKITAQQQDQQLHIISFKLDNNTIE